jgi:hypothetical protein
MLKLGILYKKNKIINHRTLRKIFFNPILEIVGYQISSKFQDKKFIGYIIRKCERNKNIFKNFYCHLFYK